MKRLRVYLVVWGMSCLGAAVGMAVAAAARPDVGPGSDMAQNIVLEAMRQDLVEHRLDELATGLNYLKMDLRSNGKLGAEMQLRVETILGRLQALKNGPLVQSRALLQEAMANPARMRGCLAEAHIRIDQLRRELGSLLLGAGMSHAAEVFADEVHEIELRQESLAWKTGAAGAADILAVLTAEQNELGATLGRLLGEVNSLSDYTTTEALAAVCVTRARKALVAGGAVPAMTSAAQAIESGNRTAAQDGQMKVLELLRTVETQLRPEARLQAVVRARNDLEDLRQKQVELRRDAETLRAEDFQGAAPGLGRREEGLLLPLSTLGVSLGIEAIVKGAIQAGGEAVQRFASHQRAEALTAAGKVEESLRQAVAKLTERIADMQKLDESYRKLQAATYRLRALQDLRERQAEITDHTDAATIAKKPVQHLADPERNLAEQVTRFVAALPKNTDWAASLGKPLMVATEAMLRADSELRKNQAVPAREAQALVVEGLDEAVRLADHEVAFLEQFWTLTQLVKDLNEVSRYATDLEGEQRDVREQVEKIAAAGKSVLDETGPQEMLAHAGGEMQDVAALIAEARQIEPMLAEVQQGMAKAALGLAKDKAAMAIPLQKEAEEKLAKTRATTLEMVARAEYLTRWISSMEKSAAAGTDLLLRQVVLRKKTQAANASTVAEVEPDQSILKGETEIWTVMEVSGDKYQNAADAMGLAVGNLKQVKQAEAVLHQKEAEEWLKKALDEMFKWLASLAKMQQAAQAEPAELPKLMSVLNRLLLLAMGEDELRDHTHLGVNQEFAGLATTQDDLKKQLDATIELFQKRETPSEVGLSHMNEAGARMIDASAALHRNERSKSLEQEILVQASLRKAIAVLMVEAFTPSKEDPEEKEKDPNAEKPNPDEMETPPPPPDAKGDWRVFLKDAATKGDAVAKSKQQWDSLSQRDRGALNENFARELPLEYREILKEYYQTLAK